MVRHGIGWKLSWLLVVVLLVVAAQLAVHRVQALAPTAQAGRPAPTFTLQPISGRPVSLQALRGRPVLVYFWASWCGWCRDEDKGLLERVWQSYQPRGVAVVGIAVDDGETSVRPFVRRNRLSYPNAIDDDGRLARDYGIVNVPEFFFIDGNGRIVRRHIGSIDEAGMGTHLDALLADMVDVAPTILEEPALFDPLPDDTTVVSIPDDDPRQAPDHLDLAAQAALADKDELLHHAWSRPADTGRA